MLPPPLSHRRLWLGTFHTARRRTLGLSRGNRRSLNPSSKAPCACRSRATPCFAARAARGLVGGPARSLAPTATAASPHTVPVRGFEGRATGRCHRGGLG